MRLAERSGILLSVFFGCVSFVLFLLFQTRGIYTGDSGDLVTAAASFGVPHPPGYPLYTLVGWIVNATALASPAWRVTILSSLPHAIVISLLFFFVYRLTRVYLAAFFAAASAVGNYLFFLYSVTPEVFALFDVFVIVLLVVLYEWQRTRRRPYWYALCFVLALSLTHHHVILFFLPAVAYLLWYTRTSVPQILKKKGSSISMVLFICLGLLPYLYIPIAASGSSIINWDRAVTPSGFMRLISRADYGTFVSGGLFGSLVTERLLQLKAYAQFVLIDLQWFGLVLALFGIGFLFQKNTVMAWLFVIAVVCLGPVFFFYASFPLVNRFTLGTYERFLLPSYIVLFLCMGAGVAGIMERMSHRVFRYIVVAALCIVPMAQMGTTLWRFWGIATDYTADNLGRDMLGSLPKDSIVLLGRDTMLFTAQYVRYALLVRPDIAVLHLSRMESPDYQQVIEKYFPHLAIPKAGEGQYLKAFLSRHAAAHPVFSHTAFAVSDRWYWVPHGLLFRLTPEDKLPTVLAMYKQNSLLWQTFHDPNAGILSRYPHLMLSDVRDVYAGARLEFAKLLLRGGLTNEAKEQLLKALSYQGETTTQDLYTYLGLSEFFLGNCQEALNAFGSAQRASIVPNAMLTMYEAETYRDCLKDEARARALFDAYEKQKKQEETSLE